MALGKVVHVKWIREGKVYMGGLCTAQGQYVSPFMSIREPTNICSAGIIQQVGETGSALATLVDISVFSATVQI
jgi:hypothetical protein